MKYLLTEIFYALSGAIVIFAMLETFWPGVVLAYINLNWVLLFWVFVGIVIVLSRCHKEQGKP